jgi:hypothetical protein
MKCYNLCVNVSEVRGTEVQVTGRAEHSRAAL